MRASDALYKINPRHNRCARSLPPDLSGGGVTFSYLRKVFCFVAMSHGPTGVKPGGGLPCV